MEKKKKEKEGKVLQLAQKEMHRIVPLSPPLPRRDSLILLSAVTREGT